MFEVEDANSATELDGCLTCRFFWFDSTELQRLGIMLKEVPGLAPPEVRQAVAALQLETVREKHDGEQLASTVRDLVGLWYRRLWL